MAKVPRMTYEPTENIVHVHHDTPMHLETRAEMAIYFDSVIAFWRKHCDGRKAFYVVSYDNLTSNLDEVEFYARQIRRILDNCAITIVRYGGRVLQRTAARMVAIQLHEPSKVYADLDEAMEVVRGVSLGRIRVAPPSDGSS